MRKNGGYRFGIGLALLLGMLSAGNLYSLDKKEFKVIVVMDTVDVWSSGIRDGFKETLDKQLSALGASASYQVFDTKLDPKTIPDIQAAIDRTKPDLICTINYPTVFADNMITKLSANGNYPFVSENCIPIQSGVVKDWNAPGGNVTGVGVFLQQNALIRLAKKINPGIKKLAFYSWDAMSQVNDWFEAEVKRACKEEGIELVEFRRVKSAEEEFAMLSEYDKKGPEYYLSNAISAFVHKDGTPANLLVEEPEYVKKNIRHLLFVSYDETGIKNIFPAGACVVWYDIGAQLAEKGIKILSGTKPGDLAWSYPRKYNIMLNLAAAKQVGITFPQNLINAAYRVYTDFDGHFTGQAK